MRLHLLEHLPPVGLETNIHRWAAARGHQLTATHVVNGQQPPDLDSFDWLVVLGGFQHVWQEADNPWLIREKEFIRASLAAGKTYLGICLGAQLLAHFLGGDNFINEFEEVGWHQVGLTEEGRKSFLFNGVADGFTSVHWHSAHFSLPPGCVRLAANPVTANQAFTKPGLPAVGLQFHPEYHRDLVRRYLDLYTEELKPGRYAHDAARFRADTDTVGPTYPLMEALLDNMAAEFHPEG